VVVAAASRDQAEWLYQAAAGFVERSDSIRKLFRCQEGYRRIRFDEMNSRIQIFAADDRTGDGIIPTLCILEELHRHRDLSLYRTWRGKLGKRGGQLVAISTAGEPDGEFEATRKLIREQATQTTTKEAFTRAASDSIVLHEYAVPAGWDVDDLETVKKANPLDAMTIEQLRAKQESPTMTPSHWRRFVCGIPNRLNAWLEPRLWDALKTDIGNVTDGDEVYVAVRAAAGVGIAIVARRLDERVAVRLEAIHAPVGSRVPLEQVEWALRGLAKRYQVREIAYDPDQFRRSAEILEQEGLPMLEVPQRPQRLSMATATLWRMASAALLSHDGDPELRTQVMAGQTKETQMGWRLDPTANTAGLIALAMAVHQATQVPADDPEFIAL
jgi:phage terminase large subunit-like protein